MKKVGVWDCISNEVTVCGGSFNIGYGEGITSDETWV